MYKIKNETIQSIFINGRKRAWIVDSKVFIYKKDKKIKIYNGDIVVKNIRIFDSVVCYELNNGRVLIGDVR